MTTDAPTGDPASTTAGRVVLVEDEAPARRMISTALRSLGFSVVPVASAESALAAIEQNRPDLVVADVRLPGATGIQFTDSLRERSETADIPVILMSAYERPREHRADRFLPKPFELSHFERVVRELSHAS
ncbi:MAG: response regulator [Dehalococcoidia bacterium]|nr:response regulator [Dehalococcoidia bacterium]